jgi:hypothetical protein
MVGDRRDNDLVGDDPRRRGRIGRPDLASSYQNAPCRRSARAARSKRYGLLPSAAGSQFGFEFPVAAHRPKTKAITKRTQRCCGPPEPVLRYCLTHDLPPRCCARIYVPAGNPVGKSSISIGEVSATHDRVALGAQERTRMVGVRSDAAGPPPSSDSAGPKELHREALRRSGADVVEDVAPRPLPMSTALRWPNES